MKSYSSKLINSLLQKVESILVAQPIDVIENNELSVYECSTWELSSPREDNTSKIGSANFIMAHNCVIQALYQAKDNNPVLTARTMFQTILTLLEAKRIIRKSPQEKRKEFKVIHND